MSQYRTGTIDVTSASATVTGTGTAWLTELSIGDYIVANDPALGPNEIVAYIIGGIASDTSLTLTALYGGPTETGLSYVGHRDFHPNGAPKYSKVDVEFAAIQNDWNSKSQATTALGSAAFVDTGTAAGEIPKNSDLGNASLSTVTTSDSDIASNRVLRTENKWHTSQLGSFMTYGGTANDITLTAVNTTAVTSLSNGQEFSFTPTVTNTGAMTATIDGITAIDMKTADGSDMPAGYMMLENMVGSIQNGNELWMRRRVESGSDYTKREDGSITQKVKRLTLPFSNTTSCIGTWTFPVELASTDDVSIEITLIPENDSDGIGTIANNATPGAVEIGNVAWGTLTTADVSIGVLRTVGAANFQSGDEMYASVIIDTKWY